MSKRLLLFLALALPACGEMQTTSSGQKLGPSSGNAALEAAALSILKTNCTACHGAASPAYGGFGGADDLGRMRTENVFVEGSPDKSRLVTVVENGSMPPGNPLSSQDKEALRNWVASMTASAPKAFDPNSPFGKVFTAVISPRCVSCHGSSGGVSLASYEEVRKIVVPGRPDFSVLYEVIADGSMPMGGSKLPASEIQMIKDWIEAGAPQ